MVGELEGKPCGLREKKLCDKPNDVATTTIQNWIKQFPEFCDGYEPQNILSLDKLGLSFKTLLEKKQGKDGKKLKQRMTTMFIVSTDDFFVF